MDSFLQPADYLSLQTPNFSTPPLPLCAEDNPSDYSLFPSPIYEDMTTPGSTCFYLDPQSLASDLSDHEYNSMCLSNNCQVSDWLSDLDQDLPISNPFSIAVASPELPLRKHESINLHRQALDFQLHPESLSSSSSLSDLDISRQFPQDLSLSAAEVQRLTAIAMGRIPPPVSSSPNSKPSQTLTKTEIMPRMRSKAQAKPSPKHSKSDRKRTVDRDATNSLAPKLKTTKTSHNQIEKRYRNNLNSKIAELRDYIPELRVQSLSDSDEAENQESRHVSKAQILTAAIKFINVLEKKLEIQRRRGGTRWV